MHSFIVLQDACLGVNTDEQVDLLKFVKRNLSEKKQVPIIVVCNKVDDPDDEELMALVKEARDEVEKVFGVNDRIKALEAITSGKTDSHGGDDLSPAFLPASFENAFLYRSASRLQLGELKRLDKLYIDKIGHEEVGKYKWKKMSDEAKYELVHQIVSDPAQYKERLEASNFDTLIDTLQFFLGGKKAQEGIIEKQLEVALTKITVTDGFAENLTAVYDRSIALGKDASHLEGKFWSLFHQCHEHSFNKFCNDPTCIIDMSAPMNELIAFAQGLHKKLTRDGSDAVKNQGTKKIVDAMKDLIRQQISVVLEKESGWTPKLDRVSFSSNRYPKCWIYQRGRGRWYNNQTHQYAYNCQDEHPGDVFPEAWRWNAVTGKWRSSYSGKEEEGTETQNPANKPIPPLSSWDGMSPKDWSTVISSILLVVHRRKFSENFGQEIADLEWMARSGSFAMPQNYCFECAGMTCGCAKPLLEFKKAVAGIYDQGKFLPYDNKKYDRAVQVKVPESIADPSHWGHLAWLFCEFMDSL